MAKNLKLKIKNTQIAEAIKLGGVKEKLAKSKEKASSEGAAVLKDKESQNSAVDEKGAALKEVSEERPRAKARSKSAFSPTAHAEDKELPSTPAINKESEETPVAGKELKSAIFSASQEQKEEKPSLKQASAEKKEEGIAGEASSRPSVAEATASASEDLPAVLQAPLPVPVAVKAKEPQDPLKGIDLSRPKSASEVLLSKSAPRSPSESRPVEVRKDPLERFKNEPDRRPRAASVGTSDRGAPPARAAERAPADKATTDKTSTDKSTDRFSTPRVAERSADRPQERYSDRRGPSSDTRPRREGFRDASAARPSSSFTPAARPTSSFTPAARPSSTFTPANKEGSVKLGPTGKHIRDLLPNKYPKKVDAPVLKEGAAKAKEKTDLAAAKKVKKGKPGEFSPPTAEEEQKAKAKFRDFREVKAVKKTDNRSFDARDRQGLRASDDDTHWRKKRAQKNKHQQEDLTIRPSSLHVRLPISVKDLAAEMKLKASQLISKLFLQGIALTLNDLLDDETAVQLLGNEFDCEIHIDKSEEKRIRITDKSIREEIEAVDAEQRQLRAPIVAFMGHVDHGKTSLIDKIRSSNRAAQEAGAITQHIGAFRCQTKVGALTILDTPGHEAFSAMRARGADVTDIVVLVVAGDEGVKPQTVEAIQHAKSAKVTIVVAINKADKPNFNPDQVYRQLADIDLLPEVWGGQTITVNCSAHTGQGIDELLEMLALQAEVLELRADPHSRARGTVLESEMHKGMGVISTLLVQNGTLRKGDAIVFDRYWGRAKTMRDENGKILEEAGPSQPVEVTGLSGLPTAGQEFIVVKSEKEAREIAEARMEGHRQSNLLQRKRFSLENFMQEAAPVDKKMFNVLLRADMQGSLEALKALLTSIKSDKIELNIVYAGIGEISESDIQMAAASKAVIIGFHTKIESHAEPLIKENGVIVHLHDIIYNALEDAKKLMAGALDKIVEEHEKGKAEVRAVFKSSHLGVIAGCIISEGSIHRNHKVRVKRAGQQVFRGTISSLRRVKEDVREVQKGFECGILLNQFSAIQEGDVIESFEEVYKSQEL